MPCLAGVHFSYRFHHGVQAENTTVLITAGAGGTVRVFDRDSQATMPLRFTPFAQLEVQARM
jgi:hypothetical protein